MSKRMLKKIQQAVKKGNYDLTHQAVEEMAEDSLGIFDIEHAVVTGTIRKTETDDRRGTRYTLIGLAENLKTEIGVVGRFTETESYLIITVYGVTR